MTQSRRQFLTTIGVAGLLGRRVVNGQTAGAPLPSVDLGEPLELLTIRNVSVIDMTGRPAIHSTTVVLDGNRIVSVGAPSQSRDSAVLDAKGKFLIPGLWDMHTHPDMRTLSLFIANGVTGIRVMAAFPGLTEGRDEIARSQRLGPRVVAGVSFNGPIGSRTSEGGSSPPRTQGEQQSDAQTAKDMSSSRSTTVCRGTRTSRLWTRLTSKGCPQSGTYPLR